MRKTPLILIFVLTTFAIVGVGLVLTFDAIAAPAELRIGYVDLQKALASTKAGVEAQKEYEQEVQQMQSKIDLKKQEFQKQQEDFRKMKDSLSGEAKAQREEKLVALEKDLKRSFEDSQEALRRKNGIILGELLKKMRKVVDQVGKDDNFTMILEKSSQSVLYADTSIDITDKVVEKFNQAK